MTMRGSAAGIGTAAFFVAAPYAAAVWAAAAAFVHWYEEPALTRQFGAEYEAYRRDVPAWWPHPRRWPGPRQ